MSSVAPAADTPLADFELPPPPPPGPDPYAAILANPPAFPLADGAAPTGQPQPASGSFSSASTPAASPTAPSATTDRPVTDLRFDPVVRDWFQPPAPAAPAAEPPTEPVAAPTEPDPDTAPVADPSAPAAVAIDPAEVARITAAAYAGDAAAIAKLEQIDPTIAFQAERRTSAPPAVLGISPEQQAHFDAYDKGSQMRDRDAWGFTQWQKENPAEYSRFLAVENWRLANGHPETMSSAEFRVIELERQARAIAERDAASRTLATPEGTYADLRADANAHLLKAADWQAIKQAAAGVDGPRGAVNMARRYGELVAVRQHERRVAPDVQKVNEAAALAGRAAAAAAATPQLSHSVVGSAPPTPADVLAAMQGNPTDSDRANWAQMRRQYGLN